MATIRLTMAQALLRFLDNQYIWFDGEESKFVEGVFGIFGHGCVVGIGEALADEQNGLPFYQAKNEQGAVHAATAFAKEHNRRKIMAVTSSIGPGALNMVVGAGTATANHIPVLLLPGDVFASRQPDPVLQQIETPVDYTNTANDAFRSVSRYWDRVNRPEQLMSAMLNAMRTLTDPADTGAVTIALPQDVQGMAYDYPLEFFAKRVHYIERRIPTKSQLDRLAKLLSKATKPLVICGGGVRYSEAGDALAAFCQRFAIPFAETQAGKGTVLWDNPFNLSGIGTTGSQAANRLAKQSDLIIGVGTRFGDFTTCSKWLFQNPACEFVSINVASFDAYKLNSLPIVADAKLTLEALLSQPQLSGYTSSWGQAIETERNLWKEEVDRLYQEVVPSSLSQARVLGELNDRLLPPSAIVVSGSGSIPSDMQRVWRTRVRGTYHMEYAFSCMGYEVAAALGAKIAHPDREVVTIIGDGAYTMLHTELLTSIQEGRKIIVVVLDNAGFHCIDNLQNSQGIVHYGNEWRRREDETGRLTGSSLSVDYALNAQSWGAVGLRADTIEELEQAVKQALAEKVSTLIHCHVAPKSMTKGYDSWWRVGTAEVSNNPKVVEAWTELQSEIAKTRQF
ncbi:3D-(3,5/4)-trihydroxycyclohexane-1,2-dione acylhydrolase (decyclizing) [Sphaerochaeta sp.]|uniref:3D-(3,5/4)-trihydroxycyclohexane-1,2-dione acylhydrolase (decyclizing) n=1 Tax=Sphaerochaeta sp. TaxID=1972642 RepID=UPI00258F7DFF|nr:3D-(3,5/4)-trihydroxycyclohexane-1,2-dione acylhydrolase (decyclizing) [Sphaerochaeta sp.]MDD3425160.1 3D-(3,5/4)-trihydroxycyclohexane-1,2-dione acylhydrolase (decyclizing) [Sphaerochaeta sp.]MDD3456876.1 3D-(3,5/4)-trihydroxycyclohexane-1,2-dione acylhydrolase (decyclizing) [Sphaerochaeta sp.]MDD4037835.1 3D-(3,5/4)-trihydroxycyclohexane-1,2-dione acylhydrolase (decyclizing) [Sphaerochaeta sp.]MDX9982892.1 3D-(3,5/4)-trihydroxycyclohexane-1,2-dione acylhydrolase (decyclizing) [Sphaerochaet